MALGGFLQGLGLAYGNSLVVGQEMDQQKAKTSLLQSQATQAQLQTQQLQQQQKTQKDLGGFIASQTALEGADASLPANQAKLYTKAAGLAASQGDFSSAKEMTELAHQATTDAQAQQKQLLEQQAISKEALATAADNYEQNPSRDAGNDLVRKAIAAGQNPADIPLPGTVSFKSWVNSQKLAGMTSKDRATFVQKASEVKDARDQRWQEHQDNVDLRRATLQQTAAYRDSLLDLRRDAIADRGSRAPQSVDIGGAKYEYDPDSKVGGERLATDPRYVKLGNKTTASQENNIVAIGGAAAESARNLVQMARFPTGTTNSPFAHITDHDFLSSIEKTGSNALTPEQVQMFQTSSSGLSTELSRVMTLGGGRGANQSVINEVKAQITPTSGDTNLEAAYKLSTGAQIVLTRMNATPAPQDQSVKQAWDATKAQLQQFPTPEQVLKASTGPQRKALSSLHSTYNSLLEQVKDLPSAGDDNSSSAPAIPAGWSVTQH